MEDLNHVSDCRDSLMMKEAKWKKVRNEIIMGKREGLDLCVFCCRDVKLQELNRTIKDERVVRISSRSL